MATKNVQIMQNTEVCYKMHEMYVKHIKYRKNEWQKKEEEMIWSFCNNGSQYFDCESFFTSKRTFFLMHALFVATQKSCEII